MKSKTAIPEFSRPVAVDKIPAAGFEKTLEANAEERQGVARRFALLDLPKLEARFTVQPIRGGLFEVKGSITADIVQQCVVTLDPLSTHLEHAVDVVFAPPEKVDLGAGPPYLDAGEGETEAIIGGVFDLGELAVQYLGIALDPYPRKPGVPFVAAVYGEGEEKVNPFAKLADLNKKPE